ncbi:60S ribosomal protein L12 [Clavispora lusitaniae ATCC 42720]|uniref:60S ribosomal protein L12 n=1 Tax=Clavispora lusitaniae (strain ATCC 42720) TaxID=306902 RepID=C4Y2B5_CLAL4|nr:60S ribosomal protein L12 [Clavispora lusitaniae ATCC 42720]EEQ38551.1 60S ribosomal protein L12 [Clavispora lusitaniae ATCC 42720]
MWVLVVNTTADRLSSTQDFLGDRSQSLTERLLSHLSGNFKDLVQRNVTAVLNVLFLLSVSWWFLQSSDDKRRGRWNNGGSGLSVLNSQLDSDLNTLEVLGGLSNVFTNLLWRQTQRTDLWGQGGRGTDFTTDGSQVKELHFTRIKLWRHD